MPLLSDAAEDMMLRIKTPLCCSVFTCTLLSQIGQRKQELGRDKNGASNERAQLLDPT